MFYIFNEILGHCDEVLTCPGCILLPHKSWMGEFYIFYI